MGLIVSGFGPFVSLASAMEVVKMKENEMMKMEGTEAMEMKGKKGGEEDVDIDEERVDARAAGIPDAAA